ncbi:hypothetical protein [Thalassorhabdomicrobium marinisediminis]|uniref:hypothetical protein n=1 Tax=Thalassorhabdomicrobium marinisediminis TaxID=2170577 RepID=UPI00249148C4|nr:hypothetical protein [Thalassorhabdomicrobium marinisediminis]
MVTTSANDLGESDILNCARVVNDASEPEPSCAQISQGTPPGGPELTIEKACSPMPISRETTIPCEITVTGTGPVNGTIFISDKYENLNFNGDPNDQIGQLSGPSEWTCESAPYGNGVWPVCSISSAEFAAMGGTATFTTSVTVSPNEMGEGVVNCALALEPDVELAQSCVDITADDPVACVPVPEIVGDEIDHDCDGLVDKSSDMRSPAPDQPELTLSKTSLGACTVNERAQTYACDFALIVENQTDALFDGPFNIQDVFGSPTPRRLDTVSAEGWTCFTAAGAEAASCFAPGLSLAQQESAKIEMTVTVPRLRNGGTFENCASVGLPVDPIVRTRLVQSLLNGMGVDVEPVDGPLGPTPARVSRSWKARTAGRKPESSLTSFWWLWACLKPIWTPSVSPLICRPCRSPLWFATLRRRAD